MDLLALWNVENGRFIMTLQAWGFVGNVGKCIIGSEGTFRGGNSMIGAGLASAKLI